MQDARDPIETLWGPVMPQSVWTHCMCDECWRQNRPGEQPMRLAKHEFETCCYCGRMTDSGIYVRDYPGAPAWCNHHED